MTPTPTVRRTGPDPDAPVYVISVAAEMAGVHPQTLRAYERAGLLKPARTAGGTRRYSDNDIHRVRRIVELTNEGIPLSGVARILELERRLAELSGPSTALVLRRPPPTTSRTRAGTAERYVERANRPHDQDSRRSRGPAQRRRPGRPRHEQPQIATTARPSMRTRGE